MSSKMREALRSAIQAGVEICKTGEMPGTRQNRIDHIIRRYGDLEFTREEMRGMLETFGRETHDSLDNKGCSNAYITQEANKILSRHLGEGETQRVEAKIGKRYTREPFSVDDDKEHSLDREVGELQGELILLTKRVAAIERRVLADGHSENCRMMDPRCSPPECTCGHDKIQEQAK